MGENKISFLSGGNMSSISIKDIEPNPYQPRRCFTDEKIGELAQSIKTYGLLQPIIVRRCGKRYQLVVGERRLLACKSLGWKSINAVVKEISDSGMAAMALIENLQRENLNFIEEAQGYNRLLQEFGFTQEALAQRLGKSQSAIANKLRLLKLPEEVKERILQHDLTERHARALLRLPSAREQQKVVSEIIEKGMTVKQTEKRIEEIVMKGGKHQAARSNRLVVRDVRIFLNTIRQAVDIIEKSGLVPEVYERDLQEYFEVIIRLPKTREREDKDTCPAS